jgi:DNA-binding transcriptional LysR family regulator
LEDVAYLLAFADAGDLSAAAKALGVNQPAVSRRLSLWREFQPPLLKKVGNRDVLTERGHQVVAAARCIDQQAKQLADFLRDREEAAATVLLAGGSTSSQWYLAPAIARLSAEFPEMAFRGRVLRGERRIAQTAAGKIDVAIVSHDEMRVRLIASNDDLAVEPIAEHALCAVTHKDSVAAATLSQVLRGQEAPLAMLVDFPLVGLDAASGIRRFLEQQARGVGGRLRFVAETGGWAAAKEFARCAVGVAVLPLASVLREDQEQLVIRRLSAELNVRHSVVYRPSNERPAVANAVQTLKQVGRELEQTVHRRWSGILIGK